MNKNFKKSQSVLEYICVALVFATVGVGTFLATVNTAVKVKAGAENAYAEDDTIIAEILDDGLTESEREWSNAGGDYEETANETTVEQSDWTESDESNFVSDYRSYE
ncbi:MAG: hypothetical protein PHP69_04570 [Candidatus Omnitrophica bacterium]|nr:hypothetical protein [Candidatus Omnitrophota bacterium]MDD5081638.1 hypothetical protein [Candidatus Omnitrophota bacterium]MDD5441327.1 hypothetical protein [Candidatus Omnitrophota bacterium]